VVLNGSTAAADAFPQVTSRSDALGSHRTSSARLLCMGAVLLPSSSLPALAILQPLS
jgi:hypothetical protein